MKCGTEVTLYIELVDFHALQQNSHTCLIAEDFFHKDFSVFELRLTWVSWGTQIRKCSQDRTGVDASQEAVQGFQSSGDAERTSARQLSKIQKQKARDQPKGTWAHGKADWKHFLHFQPMLKLTLVKSVFGVWEPGPGSVWLKACKFGVKWHWTHSNYQYCGAWKHDLDWSCRYFLEPRCSVGGKSPLILLLEAWVKTENARPGTGVCLTSGCTCA